MSETTRSCVNNMKPGVGHCRQESPLPQHDPTAWKNQLVNFVNTIPRLEQYINLSAEERLALESTTTTWGTTPYFAALMDRDDPDCPIRKQVIPSVLEQQNRYGMDDYLIWKENRATDEQRPDTIARQYKDRVAFTVTQSCAIYCRHCFRKELVVDGELELDFNVDAGLHWIAAHSEVRDVLITGGDPLLLPDEKIAYLIERLRAIPPHRDDPLRLTTAHCPAPALYRKSENNSWSVSSGADLDQHPV